jgi:hypothetical protein
MVAGDLTFEQEDLALPPFSVCYVEAGGFRALLKPFYEGNLGAFCTAKIGKPLLM